MTATGRYKCSMFFYSSRFETPKNTELAPGQPKTPRKEKGSAEAEKANPKKVEFAENPDNKENKPLSVKQIKEILDRDLEVNLQTFTAIIGKRNRS